MPVTTRPGGPLQVLQGISHAFGSAPNLSEATASTVRWVLALLGDDAGARVVLPDRAGRLRVTASGGHDAAAGRKRSARRRAAYQTKRSLVVALRRPPGRSLVLLPLVSRGRAVGVLETVARQEIVEERWHSLEAVASQAAITIRNLRERISLERQVQALGAAAGLVRELVRAPTMEEATRRTMRLCFELLHAPVASWMADEDLRELHFLGVRGMGRAKRDGVRKSLPALPKWEALARSERLDAAARFAAIAEVEDAAVIDGGDAVIFVGADPLTSSASLEVVASLFQEVLKRVAAMARAQRRSDRLDLGIAWTAHEVRGPLLAAKAAIEHLLEGNGHAGTERDLLSRSMHELVQLASLVDAVLRWAVGASPLHLRSVDLSRVVREVVETCCLESGDERVVLNCSHQVVVRADSKQLRGAIANLIRNALAYSPPGSPVEVGVASTGEVATVRIRDRGPGIPPLEREAIFDPLVRGNMGRSTRTGKGLGLFIARRILEAHGGGVWLEPSRDGCVFRVELPVNGGGGHGRRVELSARDARHARPGH